MKFFKSLTLVLMLAAVSFAAAKAISANDEIREELEAVYAKIDAAVKEKDVDTLASLLSTDYEKRLGSKTLNREESVAEMKKAFEMVKEIESAKTTIDKIQQVEGNYIVDYTQVGKAVIVGADGKENTVDATSRGRDWWVKGDDGKWMCVAAERIE